MTRSRSTRRNKVSVKSERLRAVSVRESTHSDHATKAAARALIPPIARPCSLIPAVTTLLYSTSQFRYL
jgi:hypothetical protein